MGTLLTTIGYEGLPPELFLARLRDAGVTTIVDVRAIAASRRSGYAKTALSAHLANAGIGYVHMRALGTPKEGREANKAGRMAEFRRIYDARLATPEAQFALSELGARAVAGGLCLLCLEAEPLHCHRTIVADALAARFGVVIRHLVRSLAWLAVGAALATGPAWAAPGPCRKENYAPHCVSIAPMGVVGQLHRYRFINRCTAGFRNLDIYTCPRHGDCEIEERDVRPCGVTAAAPSWRHYPSLRWEDIGDDGRSVNQGPEWDPTKGNGQQ